MDRNGLIGRRAGPAGEVGDGAAADVADAADVAAVAAVAPDAGCSSVGCSPLVVAVAGRATAGPDAFGVVEGPGATNGAAGDSRAPDAPRSSDGAMPARWAASGETGVASRAVGALIARSNALSGGGGPNADVGTRDGVAGATGAPNAGVSGVGRRPDVTGGTRTGGSWCGAAAPNESASPYDSTRGAAPGVEKRGGASRSLADTPTIGGASATDRDGAVSRAVAVNAPCLVDVGKSSAQRTLAPTGMSPPQMEHRARRCAPVTFAGSTRKTEWHSGQETFMTRRSR